MKRRGFIILLINLVTYSSFSSARADWKSPVAVNLSYVTSCAEEDNVNVSLYSQSVTGFKVIAEHPVFEVGDDNCAADFSGCNLMAISRSLQTAPLCQKVWDDGINVMQVCNETDWWRPYAMRVLVNGMETTGHWLVLSKKIEEEASWPQYLVLYEDGNMRLKPHPPLGRADVCFGSSVVIGPAVPATRPYVDIQEVELNPTTQCLNLTYRDGGHARLCPSVNRLQAVVAVKVDYRSDYPFATFRSMWVADGNSDVDHIQTIYGDFPILAGWQRLKSSSWFFHRAVRSKHNISAPDFRIELAQIKLRTARK